LTLLHHTCYKEETININIVEVTQDGDCNSDINKLYMFAAQK
jgi:hypothetical protein